jgi:hypothetical protein
MSEDKKISNGYEVEYMETIGGEEENYANKIQQ